MAAMTTALIEFSDSRDSRTYSLPNHTVEAMEVVTQKRRVPAGNQTVAEDAIAVVKATTDADGVALKDKISFEVKVKRPKNGQVADRNAALAYFRDIVAGDEFGNSVTTQEYLK